MQGFSEKWCPTRELPFKFKLTDFSVTTLFRPFSFTLPPIRSMYSSQIYPRKIWERDWFTMAAKWHRTKSERIPASIADKRLRVFSFYLLGFYLSSSACMYKIVFHNNRWILKSCLLKTFRFQNWDEYEDKIFLISSARSRENR